MKKILLACLPVYLFYLSAVAQKIIKGKVIDRTTKDPIEYAVVSGASNKQVAITDRLGHFELKTSSDSLLLHISFIGYHPIKIQLPVSDQPLLIAMERGPIDLKEVVLTPVSNINSLHTISQIDLNLQPLRSAQDLLRLVPGLFLAQHQGGGKAEQIFLRGFDADHGTDVQVSVDGIPVNLVSHVHGQGYADLHFLIPELVSNFDFGKGLYYAGHGDFTTAGYVSFRTREVLDKSMVKLEAGQFNTFRAMTMINLLSTRAREQGQDAYLAGEANYSDGPFHLPQRFSRFNLFGKYHTRLGARNRLSILLSTFSSNWNASGEIPERAVKEGWIDRFGAIDSTQGGVTRRSNMSLQLNSSLGEDLRLENQVFYSRYFFKLFANSTFFANDSINGDQIGQREWRDLFGYQARLMDQHYWGNIRLASALGLGLRYDRVNNSELDHTLHGNTLLDILQLGDISEWNAHAYLDENIEKGRWLFNIGARLDYFSFRYTDRLAASPPSSHHLVVSPKFNIQYTLNPRLQWYLKTGKGFHSNDARVVVRNQGRGALPMADGAELGLVWKPFPPLLLNTALWYLYLQQELIYSGDEGGVVPGGRTRRLGIDVSARYQLTQGLFADWNLNVARPRDIERPDGKNYLPLAPVCTSTGGLDFKLKKGWNGSISYRYMKKRPANADYSLVAAGYFVSDLTMNYTRKKYEIGLLIENLFNAQWRESQFEYLSRLKHEVRAVDEVSFTPGSPFFASLKMAWFF